MVRYIEQRHAKSDHKICFGANHKGTARPKSGEHEF